MTETRTATYRLDGYEIRSAGGDGRTLVGLAVPFDVPIGIGGNEREVFRRGAFAKTTREGNPNRVKLFTRHADDTSLPVGAATSLQETNDGLMAEMRVARTQAGDEALSLVQDGILDSFSVGFIPLRNTRAADGTIERREVKLMEISLVPYPAYEDAKVMAIREKAELERPTMTLAQAKLLSAQLRQSAPGTITTR